MTRNTRRHSAVAGPNAGGELYAEAQAPYTAPDTPRIPSHPGQHRAPCLRCDRGPRDTALSIRVDTDGSAVWYCWRCQWSGHTRHGSRPPRYAGRIPEHDKRRAEHDRERLRRLCRESVPLDLAWHNVVARYFDRRGLADILADSPADLRYHPALDYWAPATNGPERTGSYPAILAVIRDPAGNPVALHRTYLRADGSGKADVPSSRKLCPPSRPNGLRGAAIRLYSAGERLALTEGLETGLAVRIATGWPAWSCISAHGLQTVELPAGVVDVLIAADHDEAGERAAYALARRLIREGRTPRVAIPETEGADWADVLREVAHE